MLRRLRIENLVLIREAELEFAPGLNVLTGETGAGKTIFAQAIGLLLGSRGDAAAVGPAGDEAYVEAEFDVPESLLGEDELSAIEEVRPAGEVGKVLARRIFPDGRTRAYAWGRAVAVRDIVLSPIPMAIGLALGVDGARYAFEGSRFFWNPLNGPISLAIRADCA